MELQVKGFDNTKSNRSNKHQSFETVDNIVRSSNEPCDIDEPSPDVATETLRTIENENKYEPSSSPESVELDRSNSSLDGEGVRFRKQSLPSHGISKDAKTSSLTANTPSGKLHIIHLLLVHIQIVLEILPILY